MSTTRRSAPRSFDPLSEWVPARTPGTLGRWDAADGEVLALLGDLPGPADGTPDAAARGLEPLSPQGLRSLRVLARDRFLGLEDLNRYHAHHAGWEAHFDRIGALLGQFSTAPDMTAFVKAVSRWHWLRGVPSEPAVLDEDAWAKMRNVLGIATSAGAPGPSALAGFSAAEERALRITSAFETGHDLDFGAVAGNLQQQGFAVGVLQWSLGAGSLQPLLRDFATANSPRLDKIFGTGAGQFRAMLNQTHAEQLEFARSLSDGAGQLIQPWQGRLADLASDPDFRQIQLRTVRARMDVAVRQARELGLHTERSLVMLFDVVSQHGEGWRRRGNRGQRFQDQTAELELLERERLLLLADLLADTTPERYREEVRARRRTIALGSGMVNGRRFDLPRDFGLTDFAFE